MINPKIFKAYDIRGIYPTDINEENIIEIIKSIYTFFVNDIKKENLTVVLSQDMRLSSPSLSQVAKKTLIEMGAKVIDIGLAGTPTFYFAVKNKNFDCGIQISASHNPKEYNGFKIVKNSPKGLVKIGKTTGMETIKEIAASGNFIGPKEKGSETKLENIVDEEVDAAIKIVDPKKLKNIKVVADTANAMGILYLENLYKKIPGEIIVINKELDGNFPAHQPDPLKLENLKDLQAKVISEQADLGLEPDGDADRTFFVNEKGEVISASIITSLIIKEILTKNPGATVICDIRYLLNARNIVNKYGGKLVISKVGHALITEAMQENNAVFAGESSGHYYYQENGCAESSVTVVLTILNILSRENKPISEILKDIQTSYESGETNFKLEDTSLATPVLEELKQSYKEGELSTLDGIAVDFGNWRFSVRTSNTEPLMRLNVEADSENLMTEKNKELIDKIISLGGQRE